MLKVMIYMYTVYVTISYHNQLGGLTSLESVFLVVLGVYTLSGDYVTNAVLPPLPLSMQSAKSVRVCLNRTNISQSCAFMFTVHEKSQQKCKRSNENEHWWQNTEQSSWLKWLFKFRVEKSGQGPQRDAREVQNLHKNNPLRRVKMRRKVQWVQKDGEKKEPPGDWCAY